MDVLQYYDPPIDWSKFAQGPLRSDFWNMFRNVVRLCHAYKHWDEEAKREQRTRPPSPLYPLSRYGRQKQASEKRDAVRRLEGHKYRAAFSVSEVISNMTRLFEIGTTLSPEGPEFKCYRALVLAIEPYPRHERAHCRAGAF